MMYQISDFKYMKRDDFVDKKLIGGVWKEGSNVGLAQFIVTINLWP